MTGGPTGGQSEPRPGLQASRTGRLADPAFKWFVTGAGLLVLGILAWMIGATTADALPIFQKEGIRFITGTAWDPGNSRREITGTYQALPFLWGTIVTSVIAITLAVPLAVGIALYLTQLVPAPVKRPLTYAVDMLAAVPSIVYGLWAILFVVPLLQPVWTAISNNLGFIPLFAGPPTVRNFFTAGLVLGIMILPIISAVSREVIASVPQEERFAAYSLGATRWEVMRHVILPRCRPGIIGATMLGLGRALGETILVALVIGGVATLGVRLFQPGQSVAGAIAVSWKEASPEHQLGLIAMGVALFVMTIIVNVTARLIVARTGRVTGDAAL
ncbi:MAG: phosphate ABC transporter permease subunit PstC [Nitriliruptorales bacterium]|nr:phosphate ABC transporter permease subunit PstC [Nitriliruptorales bacterium]